MWRIAASHYRNKCIIGWLKWIFFNFSKLLHASKAQACIAIEMTKKIGKNVCRDLETCTSSSRSTLTKPKFTAIGMVEVVTVYCTFSTFDRPFRISMVISPFCNNLWNILSDSFAQLSKDLKSSSIVETQVNLVFKIFRESLCVWNSYHWFSSNHSHFLWMWM